MSMLDEFEENKKEYELIRDLTEARLIKSDSNFRQYTSQDFTDIIFLYFISLKILKSEFEFAPNAGKYATATARYGNFDDAHFQSTDLYVLLKQLFNGNHDIFKKREASELHLDKIDPYFRLSSHERDIIKWLRNLTYSDDGTDRRFLIKMESALGVTNSGYKAIRRLAVEWNKIDLSDKQLGMTRLLMALRFKARRSELLPYLEKLAKSEKYEIKNGVINPETGSVVGKSSILTKIAKGAALFGSGYVGMNAVHSLFGKKQVKEGTGNWNRWWSNIVTGQLFPVSKSKNHDEYFFEHLNDFLPEVEEPEEDAWFDLRDTLLLTAYEQGWQPVLYNEDNHELCIRASPEHLRALRTNVINISKEFFVQTLVVDFMTNSTEFTSKTLTGDELEKFIRTGQIVKG